MAEAGIAEQRVVAVIVILVVCHRGPGTERPNCCVLSRRFYSLSLRCSVFCRFGLVVLFSVASVFFSLSLRPSNMAPGSRGQRAVQMATASKQPQPPSGGTWSLAELAAENKAGSERKKVSQAKIGHAYEWQCGACSDKVNQLNGHVCRWCGV